MSLKTQFLVLFAGSLFISVSACSNVKQSPISSSKPAVQPASQPATATSTATSTSAGRSPLKRGADFTVQTVTALADILGKPGNFDGKTVKIRGEVARCCLKKGCWMELTVPGIDQGIRVRFKDYAFFVPLDSAGASALVEGQVNTRKLEAAMAKHLEEEGAKIFRNEAGDAIELALVATAVELTR